VAGDFEEIFCSHPEFGQMRFYPKANESFTVDRGGISSNDDNNQITSAGHFIDQMNRRRWSVEGDIAVDLKTSLEEDYLSNIGSSAVLATWTFTHISGMVLRGRGKPVGEITTDTNAGTLTLKVAGEDKLKNVA